MAIERGQPQNNEAPLVDNETIAGEAPKAKQDEQRTLGEALLEAEDGSPSGLDSERNIEQVKEVCERSFADYIQMLQKTSTISTEEIKKMQMDHAARLQNIEGRSSPTVRESKKGLSILDVQANLFESYHREIDRKYISEAGSFIFDRYKLKAETPFFIGHRTGPYKSGYRKSTDLSQEYKKTLADLAGVRHQFTEDNNPYRIKLGVVVGLGTNDQRGHTWPAQHMYYDSPYDTLYAFHSQFTPKSNDDFELQRITASVLQRISAEQ